MTETVYTMRAARQIDAATVAAARARAAREQAAADLEVRQAREQEAERARQRARSRRVERAERRRATRTRLIRSALAHRALASVAGVVAASVVIAWPAQAEYFASIGVSATTAVAVPALLEGLTWTMGTLASVAVSSNRPAGLYRAMTWLCALVAAGVNLAHGTMQRGPLVGVVYALASLGGVGAWELYVRSQRHAVAGRSAADVRLALRRRLSFPLLARRAARLRAAVGLDLSSETAWVLAWRAVYGADPGVTARTLRRQHRALEDVRNSLYPPPNGGSDEAYESIRRTVEDAVRNARPVTALLAEAPVASETYAPYEQVSPRMPVTSTSTRRTRTRPAVRAARREAARTARAALDDADTLEAKRQAARRDYLDSLTTGSPLSSTALARRHGMSEPWARKQINAALKTNDRTSLRLVDGRPSR